MYNPTSTYRVQFHKEFDLTAFEKIIPYLAKLGIKMVYASPILKAAPGSTHGYDCTDPHHINPEIGTLDQVYAISKTLKAAGIGWLQDISPNHMAYHSENKWLMDVLQNGQRSKYAGYFDIDWTNPEYNGKLQAPFLATSIDDAIEQGKIELTLEAGQPVLKYEDRIFPVTDSGHPLNIDSVNADSELLRKLIHGQNYVLCNRSDTDNQLNYRRFFTINELICLNMQDDIVFNDYHTLVKKLVDDEVIQGIRVDHIDGLADPTTYLFQLRRLLGDEVYIIAEKILERNERMNRHWPADGNTGYDFMALSNNLLTKKKNEGRFNAYYYKQLDQKEAFSKQLLRKKALILCSYMNGDLDNLLSFLDSLHLVTESELQSVGRGQMREAIAAFLVRCPVYRYYSNQLPMEPDEAQAVQLVLNEIRTNEAKLKDAAALLEAVLLTKPLEGNTGYNVRAARFFMRCMQFSGPLMAKGVEDTLMYTYNRFIGHNEVGDSPEDFGISVRNFAHAMHVRQLKWPYSLNATSTHDTKRGEDIRARLNVLTAIPSEWLELVSSWRKMNATIKDNEAPDDNDEYSIYQTLVGSCFSCSGINEDIKERLLAYYQKAFREAKTHTDWSHPDKQYEDSARSFLDTLFSNATFLASLTTFQDKITDAGIVNSLAQVLLKCTCPGIPDIYQGSELWNFSLVDPDNRRSVNYSQYSEALDYVCTAREGLVKQLWAERKNGQIKLWLTHALLSLRNNDVNAFTRGYYISLEVGGIHRRNVLAYARVHGRTWYVFVIPLHIASLCQKQGRTVSDIDWGNTYVILPEEVPADFENIVNGVTGLHQHKIPVKSVFEDVPFAIIRYKVPENSRGAGVLLPAFSIHSPFGIGDFGKGARAFADFLCRSKQKYWQLLPLNQTDEQNGNSPYSSISALAGNPLLISPEMLVYDGLLKEEDLQRFQLPNEGKVNYERATKSKFECLALAYQTFKNGYFPLLEYKFGRFCHKHAYWLDDFACFVALKKHFNSEHWYKWPAGYKQHDRTVLDKFVAANTAAIDEIKWLQFLAEKQWKVLRDYCNNLGISLVGDIPFYTSYDSADVWAHPEYFAVDEAGSMTGVGGVPPDYFSATGQLWNVPTYNWDNMRADHYKWWAARLRRQLELFDLIRIDHFRAFADYWLVPAGETTAQNGRWIKGPGQEFFKVMLEQLGTLPFIAEDLGNDMEQAYVLRDKIGLPGMKVLQFAWGTNMPRSVDAPHNYPHNCIVYTGTHDNNTTVGWYNEETQKEDHKRLKIYLARNVKKNNIHIVMSRMAYASVAKIAILPIQDILGLDESARINYPGSEKGNWVWRLPQNALRDKVARMLEHWTKLYNRE